MWDREVRREDRYGREKVWVQTAPGFYKTHLTSNQGWEQMFALVRDASFRSRAEDQTATLRGETHGHMVSAI